jgi:copper(I)-binding protein
MRYRWFAIAAVILAGVAAFAFLGPLSFLPGVSDAPSAGRTPPVFEQQVRAEGGRLVLPSVAGVPATVHFSISNSSGRDTFYLTGLAIEGAGRAAFFETAGPDMRPLVNVAVQPGASVRFDTASPQVALADYGENVVPGQVLDMTLEFGNAKQLTLPIRVESAIGPGGTVRPDGVAGASPRP